MSDLREALEDIFQATRRHSLEVGFNHSAPTAKELQARLDAVEQIALAALAQQDAVEPTWEARETVVALAINEELCRQIGAGEEKDTLNVTSKIVALPILQKLIRSEMTAALSAQPQPEAVEAFVQCADCAGTGLSTNRIGEPDICKACRGNTVVPSQPEAALADWRDDPTSDERWSAGLDFAMIQLCAVMGVDPHDVTWDAATEEVEGDVRAVIWNILRAKMGEDWKPEAPPLAPDERMRRALENGIKIVKSAFGELVCGASKHVPATERDLFEKNFFAPAREWLQQASKALSRADKPTIGGTAFCGHGVMASICDKCGDEATKSEGGARIVTVRRLVDDPNSASGQSLRDVVVTAAPAAVDVEEWQLVPKKPTAEMIRAAYDSATNGTTILYFKQWAAMLAVAPRLASDAERAK